MCVYYMCERESARARYICSLASRKGSARVHGASNMAYGYSISFDVCVCVCDAHEYTLGLVIQRECA